MTRRQVLALLVFTAAVIVGTVLDARARAGLLPRQGNLLVADLHVHPFPGDGSLTVWQLQREAARRGVDLIAITSHNHRVGLVLADLFGFDRGGAIVLPGQEVTSAGYHMIAAGISQLIDWRLSAADAIVAVQQQGGVAIAAHPVNFINAGWDRAARRTLDGSEIMHPLRFNHAPETRELEAFFDTAGEVNPGIAAIGSTDFHMTAPLGLCRTYVLARERTAAAVTDAIREGRTAAACGDGDPVGPREQVSAVRAAVDSITAGAAPTRTEKLFALIALMALGALVVPTWK